MHKVNLFTGKYAEKCSLDGESFVKYFKHKEAPPAIAGLSMSLLVCIPGNRRELHHVVHSGTSSDPGNT